MKALKGFDVCGEYSPCGHFRCNATKGHEYDHFRLNADFIKIAQWPRSSASAQSADAPQSVEVPRDGAPEA